MRPAHEGPGELVDLLQLAGGCPANCERIGLRDQQPQVVGDLYHTISGRPDLEGENLGRKLAITSKNDPSISLGPGPDQAAHHRRQFGAVLSPTCGVKVAPRLPDEISPYGSQDPP